MRPELLKPALLTVVLLGVSNVFMTFAWYGHLRTMQQSPWWAAALVSWSIALGEYLIMVPANRLGYAGGLSGAQLKIMQECVTLAVFVPFMGLFMCLLLPAGGGFLPLPAGPWLKLFPPLGVIST